MDSGKTFGGIGGFLLLLAVVFGYRYYNKSETSDEVLRDLIVFVSEVEGYEKNPDYYNYLAESAHDEAFADSYHMAIGKRDRTTFDVGLYAMEVFPLMIEQAERDKSPHVVAALKKLFEEDEEEDAVKTGGKK